MAAPPPTARLMLEESAICGIASAATAACEKKSVWRAAVAAEAAAMRRD